MLIKTERITRKQLEKARHCGELVDLSDQAVRAGLLCRCEMSKALYWSLCWKYPSAGERDTVDVVELLGELRERIKRSRERRKWHYFIRPPRPTWWMESRYFLKALVVYRGTAVQSVVILPGLAKFDSLLSVVSAPAVPASMLVRMMLLIQQLSPLCYPAERTMVRSLEVTACELLRRSPLVAQIHNYLSQQQPSLVPSGYSGEEYREVTLRSFWQQLELTAAVADKLGADIELPVSGVLQLMANYVGFIPAGQQGAQSVNKLPLH